MTQSPRAQRPRTAPVHRLRTLPPRRSAPDTLRVDRPRAASSPDESHGLTVEVRPDRVSPLVSVAGELDLSSSGLLSAMLEHVRRSAQGGDGPGAGAAPDVHVDLARVTFADSWGLAPVLDDRTVVVAASAPVRQVLRLLHDLPTDSAPPA